MAVGKKGGGCCWSCITAGLETCLDLPKGYSLDPWALVKAWDVYYSNFNHNNTTINPRTLVMPSGSGNKNSQGMEKQLMNKE